jgi:hypothetical protein
MSSTIFSIFRMRSTVTQKRFNSSRFGTHEKMERKINDIENTMLALSIVFFVSTLSTRWKSSAKISKSSPDITNE